MRGGLVWAFAAAMAAVAAGGAGSGLAQGQAVQALAAALKDVPGCQGEKVETMSLSQGTTSYRWASRSYECGEARMTAMVGVTPMGAAPAIPGAEGSQDVEMQSGGQLYRARTIRGFRVVQGYNEEDKSGAVVVMFGREGESGSLVVQFEGMALDVAMGHAERFDWAAMQRAAQTK